MEKQQRQHDNQRREEEKQQKTNIEEQEQNNHQQQQEEQQEEIRVTMIQQSGNISSSLNILDNYVFLTWDFIYRNRLMVFPIRPRVLLRVNNGIQYPLQNQIASNPRSDQNIVSQTSIRYQSNVRITNSPNNPESAPPSLQTVNSQLLTTASSSQQNVHYQSQNS